MMKICRLEVWFFCETHHRIPFFLALHLSGRLLKGYFFVKTLATFASVDSPSIFLTINPLDHAEWRAPIFQNQGSFPHGLSLKRSWWPLILFTFLTQVTHYLTAVKILKNLSTGIFSRERPLFYMFDYFPNNDLCMNLHSPSQPILT